MVSMRKYASSRFIKLDDVADRPRRETIVEVTEGKFDKPVLKFASGAQFSCNATNVDTLITAYGDDSDDWLGNEIELYAGQTTYNGDVTESVLIRRITSSPPAPTKPQQRDELDDEVPF